MNPRYPLRYVRFRGGSFQPLTHLSASDTIESVRRRSPAPRHSVLRVAQDFACGLPLLHPVTQTPRAGDPGCAHARKTAQFQPLTHLSGETVASCRYPVASKREPRQLERRWPQAPNHPERPATDDQRPQITRGASEKTPATVLPTFRPTLRRELPSDDSRRGG